MKLLNRAELAARAQQWRAQNCTVVWTNGCFDVLHAGHVELLQTARGFGDVLVVGINSDASVKRLKGESRPINEQAARAFVLSALECVDAVCIYEEDTPNETIKLVRPDVHVKGGDYRPDDLPEAAIVRAGGGEIKIVPLRDGLSTTKTLQKLSTVENDRTPFRAVVVIPARWASTRFPGKPLAELGGVSVIERVVAQALKSSSEKPVWVATDDERIARAVEDNFAPSDARVARTSDCATGTDRLAQAMEEIFPEENEDEHRVVVNLQGDEPFVDPRHIDDLIETMRRDRALQMATLASPISDDAQKVDANVVKVARAQSGDALYFSRSPIPFARDETATSAPLLRHIGIYAYTAKWLKQMAALAPSPLEETEKLEQLRALEGGVRIAVAVVDDVVGIAIDTPADLQAAQRYLSTVEFDPAQD